MSQDIEVMKDEGPIFKLIDKLRWDADIGKYKHFNAARRSKKLHISIGLPVIIINIIVGSSLFASLQEKVPSAILWVGGILALIGAILAAIQTFFRFGEACEAHHRLGNDYACVVRDIEELVARHLAKLVDGNGLSEGYTNIRCRYEELVKKGESHITTGKDYLSAVQHAKGRVESLNKHSENITIRPNKANSADAKGSAAD
ncbi:MAG: hypothetical protein BBJ57_11650 [Desulfobacterales bacterium PC51MH44]|nr:MAG: hypothetical protein BBJ57_11650 [Desulfobacterales bacterium PC51MH44]